MAGVAAQTLKPAKWVIVDDRSTDDTWTVINAAARRYPFIEPVQVQGGAERALGSNVVRVFNTGFARIAAETDFAGQDGRRRAPAPRLFRHAPGPLPGGTPVGDRLGQDLHSASGRWVLERSPDFHASGPCKTYRMTCFREIGGLIPILGWDILDEAQARRHGWQTRGFRDLPLYHLRMMGSASGMARANLRYGRCYYGIRAHPLLPGQVPLPGPGAALPHEPADSPGLPDGGVAPGTTAG